MNKLSIINTVKKTFGNTGLRVKQHTPEILVATGVVGIVTSTVMACKATRKLDAILEESKGNLDKINNYVEEKGYSEEYTEKDHQKDVVITYKDTAIDLIKLYAPAVIVGTLGITAVLSSHNILRNRNVALATTVTALTANFKDYRGRVVERFGKDLDRELRYNIKATEIEETTVDAKGKEKTVKKMIDVMDGDPSKYSEFARFFDDGCVGWEKNAEYNLMFLKRQQDYANELLQKRGHLFLNEVYSMLGIPKTKIGQQVGWVYDEFNPVGDNYVDFGIYDINSTGARDFVNGYERSILLDFNVDGAVWDCLK